MQYHFRSRTCGTRVPQSGCHLLHIRSTSSEGQLTSYTVQHALMKPHNNVAEKCLPQCSNSLKADNQLPRQQLTNQVSNATH